MSSSLFVASVSYPVCSYMHTFPIKVYHKVIEILAMRWLGPKLMQIFKETTANDESYLAERSPRNYDEVSIICFPHKLNIAPLIVGKV